MNLFAMADPRPIHFMGIAGAGMSGLALLARQQGVAITGCDTDPSGAADLAALGVEIWRGHAPEHVAGARALVVTAAVAGDHPELERARALGIPVVRRADALGQAVAGGLVVAVAGTHGKTTTTVMVTEALAAAGRNPTGLAGGRVASWGGNARLGGRDVFVKTIEPLGIKIVADVSTDPGQVDFSAAVLKARQANADALFVYCNEEESARALRELRKQGYDKPIIGETVLTSQKVIELAGDAANGAVAHVGLTADAPSPLIRDFAAKFQKEYRYKPDHNGLKGYTAMYVVKAVTEKVGKFDPKAFAKTMHGVKLMAKEHPGILMDVSFDKNGDLDRESFMTKITNGKQEVIATLPPLSAGK